MGGRERTDCLVFNEVKRVEQGKLKPGRTFLTPQEKLNEIYEIFKEDMVCAFCEQTYLYNKIAKVIGYT